jgi:hypothetical protein
MGFYERSEPMTRLRLAFFLAALALCQTASMAESRCREGYQTIFQILDCDRQPVESVDVTITLCCTKLEKKGLTNNKGEVMFPFNHEDICARTIFGQASEKGIGHCFGPSDATGGKILCKISVVVCGE